jgi:hypothetical protein
LVDWCSGRPGVLQLWTQATCWCKPPDGACPSVCPSLLVGLQVQPQEVAGSNSLEPGGGAVDVLHPQEGGGGLQLQADQPSWGLSWVCPRLDNPSLSVCPRCRPPVVQRASLGRAQLGCWNCYGHGCLFLFLGGGGAATFSGICIASAQFRGGGV